MSQESIADLLVSLSLDTKGFDSNMANINKSTKQMENSFKQSKQALDLSEKSLEDYNKVIKSGESLVGQYKSKLEMLTNSYDKSKEKVSALVQRQKELPQTLEDAKVKLKELENTVGTSSDEYKKQEKLVQNLTSEYDNFDKTLNNAVNASRNIENQMRRVENQIKTTESEVRELSGELSKLDQVKFNNLSSNLNTASDKFNSVGNGAKNVASALQPIATMTSAAGVASAGLGATFEKNLAMVGTLVGKSGSDMMVYKDKIKELANGTGVSMGNFAGSMYQAISATGDLEGSFGLVESSAKLAKGGFTDVTTATDILTTALNGYGLGTEEVTKVSDLLIQTQNKGKTTVGELASSLGAVIPIASSVGYNMEEVSASMALMTSKGIATSESATYLKSMLSELGKSGSITDKALRELSGKGFAELKAEGKPTAEILGMLDEYAKKNGKSLKDMFGSVEAGSAALVLAGGSGEEYTNMLKEMNNSADATNKAFETMGDTAGDQLASAINELKNTMTDLGIQLLPVISGIAEKLSGLAEKFNSLSPSAQKAILVMGGIVAIGVPLLSMFGSISLGIASVMGAFSSLAAAIASAGGVMSFVSGIIATVGTTLSGLLLPIGIVVASVIAFAVAWKNNFLGIQEITSQIFTTLKELFSDVVNVFMSIFNIFKAAFSGDWSAMWENIKLLFSNVWELIKDLLKGALDIIISIIVNIGSSLMEAAYNAFNKVKEGFTNAWNAIKEWFDKAKEDPVAAIKGIGSSLYEAGKSVFTSLWDGMKDIWSGITGWFNEKIEWVKSKFSWITGKASEANTAAQSMPNQQSRLAFALLSVPQVEGLETRARSYQSNTFAGKMVQSKSGDGKELNDIKALLSELINISSAGRVITVDNTINLDARAVAKGTAKYMEAEINTMSKRKMRYGGNL